jgi:ubiquinol-cytochrome c reductase cytochrome b subunit
MFLAILILLAMPFTDLSRSRGIQFRPLSKIAFFIFLGNFLILMQLGAKHVESPYIEFGQISTVVYFSYFLIIVPVLSLFENSLLELASFENNVFYKKPLKIVYSNDMDYRFLNIYVKKVFCNKIALLLYLFYFILFSVFIPILLIVLTDYYYIDSPYSLVGVDYADNKYAN